MDRTLDALRAEAARLAALFEGTAVSLEQAAQELRTGNPPAPTLEDTLRSVSSAFAALQQWASQIPDLAADSPPLADLPTITRVLDDVSASRLRLAVSSTRERALGVLNEVLAIRHKAIADFPPLANCHGTADALRQEILGASPGNALPIELELEGGTHPLASFNRLVRELNSLDDATIEALDNQVRHELGSALAIAAIRGLLVSQDIPSPVPTPPPSIPEPALTTEIEGPPSPPQQVKPADAEEPVIVPLLEAGAVVAAPTAFPPTPELAKAAMAPKREPLPPVEQIVSHPDPDASDASAVQDSTLSLTDRVRRGDLSGVEPLAWRLLSERRADVALQLVSTCRDNFEDPSNEPRLLPWMLRPLLLGPLVGYPNGEVFRALRDDYSHFQEDWLTLGDPSWRTGIGLLLAAGALRPALLAPGTGVSALLRSLHLGPGLERTYELTAVLAEHAERQHPVDLSALLGAATQVEWQKRQQQLTSEIDEWLSQAPQRTLIFAGATKVWRQWVSQGGILRTLVSTAKAPDEPLLLQSMKELDRLDDEGTFKQLVNRTDRDQLGRKRGPDISGTSLIQLRRGIKEAASFARQAQQLASARPNDRDYLAKYAREIQTRLLGLHDEVTSELRELTQSQQSLPLVGSALHMADAVNDVVSLVKDAYPPQQEPDPNGIVQRVLLCSTAITLDDEWQPLEPRDRVLEGVLNLVDSPAPSYQEALALQTAKGDHVATKRLLSVLGEEGLATDRSDELWTAREAGIEQQRWNLAHHVNAATAELEAAVAAGAIGEADRSDLASRIAGVRTELDTELRFSVSIAALAEVRALIHRHKASASERLRAAMDTEGVGPEHPAYARIHQCLSDGDILIANEYLDYVRRGEALPEGIAATSAFDEFFPDAFRKISSALETSPFRNLNKVLEAIRAGEPIADLAFPSNSDEREDSALFMRSWVNLDQSRGDTRDSGIKQLMVQLGFPVKSVTNLRSVTPRFKAFEVKTEVVIADRFICPVPAFGSNAAGKYRVICALERPTEEDLLAEVDRGGDALATIVLYLGVLSEQRRRLLAKLSRQKPRPLVVLDSALALFLAARSGARLRALFECALPFTSVEPFTTTAGLVPPEMFFGRERERQSIIDPQGSCFIYGGRQLGKTALLRHVVRTFNEPQLGKVALWIDLRPAGIGLDRPLDEIWNVLAQEFKRAGIIGSKTLDHAGPDKISKEIEAWINADEHRRIVLMLDEADKFLESDGEGPHHFRHSALLKGLMDRTNRRFKVVFAGLHNVQRATQQANHPLAHFNDPLCIGPLIDRGEAQEARALIEVPFSALGYRFADAEPVTRILAQTNYYPSLIQLSCAQLLKHVSSQRGLPFDVRKMPPYEIDTKHVEDAYASQELWKQVKDRFQWTLQLDQRYEVIAYSIALESKADPKKLNEGFDVRWIRDQALLFWDSGFTESRTEEAIRVLADEMVGLGLLRQSPDYRYALRNANVLSLMGTDAQIEDALERPREPPVEYQASAFRTVLRSAGNDKAWPRSPLTALQTERLLSRSNDLTVVCGTRAGALDLLGAFCKAATAEQAFHQVTSPTVDLKDFTEVLHEAFKHRTESTTIVHIGSEVSWTRDWLEHTRDRLGKLVKAKDFVKVVFEASPDRLWTLCGDKTDRNWLQQGRPHFLTVTAWKEAALRQFLEDSNLSSDVGSRKRLTELTGNWHGLLSALVDPPVGTIAEGQARLEARWTDSRWRSQMRRDFGLETAPVISRVMTDFAMVGDATVKDLAGVVQDASPDEVEKVVFWAELLALVEAHPNDKWAVDPVLQRLLTSD